MARGFPERYCELYCYFSWIIFRGTRTTNRLKKSRFIEKDAVSSIYYLPSSIYYTPIEMGGVGEYPGLFLMASRDLLLYRRGYERQNEGKLMREGSFLVNSVSSTIRQKLVDSIIRGDTKVKVEVKRKDSEIIDVKYEKKSLSGPFRQFTRKFIYNSRRARNAVKSISYLNSRKVDIGDLAYTMMDIRSEKNLLISNPSIREVSLIEASYKFAKISKLASTFDKDMSSVSGVMTNYEWISLFKMKIGEECEDRIDVCPIIGLDSMFVKLIRVTGVNAGKQNLDKTSNKIQDVISKDPFFPRDIRLETLLDFLAQPTIYTDKDIFLNALVAMGAAAQTATEIYNIVSSSPINNFRYSKSLKLFSFGDDLLPICDMTYFREEICKVVSAVPVSFTHYLYEIGFALWVEHYIITGKLVKFSLVVSDKAKELFLGEYLHLNKYRYSELQDLIGDIGVQDD